MAAWASRVALERRRADPGRSSSFRLSALTRRMEGDSPGHQLLNPGVFPLSVGRGEPVHPEASITIPKVSRRAVSASSGTVCRRWSPRRPGRAPPGARRRRRAPRGAPGRSVGDRIEPGEHRHPGGSPLSGRASRLRRTSASAAGSYHLEALHGAHRAASATPERSGERGRKQRDHLEHTEHAQVPPAIGAKASITRPGSSRWVAPRAPCRQPTADRLIGGHQDLARKPNSRPTRST